MHLKTLAIFECQKQEIFSHAIFDSQTPQNQRLDNKPNLVLLNHIGFDKVIKFSEKGVGTWLKSCDKLVQPHPDDNSLSFAVHLVLFTDIVEIPFVQFCRGNVFVNFGIFQVKN